MSMLRMLRSAVFIVPMKRRFDGRLNAWEYSRSIGLVAVLEEVHQLAEDARQVRAVQLDRNYLLEVVRPLTGCPPLLCRERSLDRLAKRQRVGSCQGWSRDDIESESLKPSLDAVLATGEVRIQKRPIFGVLEPDCRARNGLLS